MDRHKLSGEPGVLQVVQQDVPDGPLAAAGPDQGHSPRGEQRRDGTCLTAVLAGLHDLAGRLRRADVEVEFDHTLVH